MIYTYDGRFRGNILVVGRTGCGQTGFVQKLAVNRFFGDIIKAEWVSYVKLDNQEKLKFNLVWIAKSIFIIRDTKNNSTIFLNILRLNLALKKKALRTSLKKKMAILLRRRKMM